MIFFVVGPEMTFGVDCPHVVLHEAGEKGSGLKNRRLKRPHVVKW